jgi:hypothetical protein
MDPSAGRDQHHSPRDAHPSTGPPVPRGYGRWAWVGFRGVLAALLLLGLSVGTIALASDHVAPLSDSPTATELSENAPLAEAFRDAFVGETGSYDPQNGIVSPGETSFQIEVKAAHDGTDIFFRYDVPTPLASYYMDYVVYQDGEWIRGGRSPVGPEPHGLYEDRITMLVDDGSVRGFANQGGWLTCHEDMRAPFMYAGASDQEVAEHPVMGEIYGAEEVRKYIPQSRDAGPEWWRAGWDSLTVENVDRYAERHEAGVFLDLWHWRAHRSNPVGYSDNEYVFEYRRSSPGAGPFGTNWDAEAGQPSLMFDPEITGFAALDWARVQGQDYAFDEVYFLAQGINAVPFDPDHAWQNGDTIPRRVLNPEPTESRGSISADGQLVADGDAWRWQVELRRALDTGYETADKAFVSGRTYNAAIAVHRLATGSRWHFVSLPFTIGVDMPADVTAVQFDGDSPDWSTIDATTLTVIYPGQTSWEFITSDEHPGATAVRADSMSVIGCHDEIGLGEANRAIEASLAGVASPDQRTGGPLGGLLDPANATIIFLAVAIGTLAIATAVGFIRSRRVAAASS